MAPGTAGIFARACTLPTPDSDRCSELLPDPNEMVQHLQTEAETQRDLLSRELHDELGGLMISAVMDLASAESQLGGNEDARRRLARVRQTLASAIDFERKMVESLRPTLLDNCGLYAAVRWQVARDCRDAGIRCTETYPDAESGFAPEVAIALFRIVQEGLNVCVRQPSVTAVHVSIDMDDCAMNLRVAHDGGRVTDRAANRLDDYEVCSMSHRVHGLGGELRVIELDDGGVAYASQIPRSRILPES
jgi:signal transduction histidine kinase